MSVPQSTRIGEKTGVKKSDKFFWTWRAIKKVLERVDARRYATSAADAKILLSLGNTACTKDFAKLVCEVLVPGIGAFLCLSLSRGQVLLVILQG